MSLRSTLLRYNSDSKKESAEDDLKDGGLDQVSTISKSKSREESLSSPSSDSLSSERKQMDYTSPLCFYSQVGHIDANKNDKSPESALHIVLPNQNVRLGYSIGYKIDDSMDIVDGDVWLYRPQNYVASHMFYLCLSLTFLFAIDTVVIMLILLNDNYPMHFNLSYNGGNSAFVVVYYLVLIISIIGCTVCIWIKHLQGLCVFYSSFITDAIFSLFWLEHHLQFIHFGLIVVVCYLLARYLSLSFGKWNFLQSQTRLDELEQLHREGRF
eukprot:184803_1